MRASSRGRGRAAGGREGLGPHPRARGGAGAGTLTLTPLARRPASRSPSGLADEAVEFSTSKGVRVVTSFDAMALKEDLLRGVYQYGFEKPSAIQQRAVLPIVEGRDVIAQAQSGTGKTSLIAITLCQLLDTSSNE